MTVVAITGLMGSGKTATLTAMALEHLERRHPPYRVFTNFQLGRWVNTWSCPPVWKHSGRGHKRAKCVETWTFERDERVNFIRSLDDVFTAVQHAERVGTRNGWKWTSRVGIFLDEVHMMFPSRNWQGFTPEMGYMLSQLRKMGCEMYYSAQHIDRADVYLRDLTEYEVRCSRVPVPLVNGLVVMRSKWLPGALDPKRGRLSAAFHLPDYIPASTLRAFDTLELVELSKHLTASGGRRGAKRAPASAEGSAA